MGLHARRARTIASALAIFLAGAPLTLAHAQGADAPAAPAKKPKKPKAAPTPPVEEAPPPPPVVEPTPPPPAPEPAAVVAPAPAPEPVGDLNEPITNTYEKPGQTYYFVGLRYRGTVIPKFMLNLFVDEGKTIYSNSVGVEFDIRKDNFSMIPWVTYNEYGTGGDMLFHQKGNPTGAQAAQYYSDVNSSLKAVYVGVDLKWSKEISSKVAFEYGAGFGLGVLFGSLVNDWVYTVPNGTPGSLRGSDGTYYAPCTSAQVQAGTPSCLVGQHNNASTAKVDNFHESTWFGGGSVPAVFPHISIPELGIRYKPIKQLETRFTVGFSLTGFFFQLSASYGFEKRKPEGGSEKVETPEKSDKPGGETTETKQEPPKPDSE